MRIIAGHARGRRLFAPKGSDTRPTPDRVKEAVFSTLEQRVVGAFVLDLFAGTGALGLEAHSRGAAHVTLVEKAPRALAIIERNVSAVAHDRVEVIAADARRVLDRLAQRERHYDLVFLDPPYALGLLDPTLAALCSSGVLSPTCTIVCEHHGHSPAPHPPAALVLKQTRLYGDVAISYFEVKKDA